MTPIVVNSIPSQPILSKKDYTSMVYDQGETLILMEEILRISNAILKNVDNIVGSFNTLQGKYAEFTNYNEIMNMTKTRLQNSSEEILEKVTQMMQVLAENLNFLVEQDDTLKDDIRAINGLLANGELPESYGN